MPHKSLHELLNVQACKVYNGLLFTSTANVCTARYRVHTGPFYLKGPFMQITQNTFSCLPPVVLHRALFIKWYIYYITGIIKYLSPRFLPPSLNNQWKLNFIFGAHALRNNILKINVKCFKRNSSLSLNRNYWELVIQSNRGNLSGMGCYCSNNFE